MSKSVSRRDFLKKIGKGTLGIAAASFLSSVPALGKEKVKISFIGPLTGGNAAMGLGGRNSFLLGVRQYNRGKFGEKKYEYKVEIQDTECVPATGVRVANKVASDPDVIAGASHYCSMVGISTKPVFTQFKFPSMVWGAVLPDITIPSSKYITRVNGTQREQNAFHAEWSTQTVKETYGKSFKRYVVMHDITDYGKGHAKYFIRSIKEEGGEVLDKIGISIGQKDFTSELTRVKDLDPDGLFYGGLTPEGVRIRIQQLKQDIPAQYEGTSGIMNEDFNETVGAEGAEGCVCFLEGAPLEKLPGGPAFKKAYEKEGFKQDPEAYGIFGYMASRLIMNAIEKVGPDREKVADVLANTERESSPIGSIKFDENGQNVLAAVTGYVSQDGDWVPWEDSEYATGERALPGIEHL